MYRTRGKLVDRWAACAAELAAARRQAWADPIGAAERLHELGLELSSIDGDGPRLARPERLAALGRTTAGDVINEGLALRCEVVEGLYQPGPR